MTVSRPLSSLNIFQSKVEEALNLVPGMCAQDKLKAVHFWNIISERLQDIVNNSADINAVALSLEEEESAKVYLEKEFNASKMNLAFTTENGPIVTEREFPNSHFTNSSTMGGTCSDTNFQYQSNVSNNQFKSFTSDSSIFSNGEMVPQQLLPEHTNQDIVIENTSTNNNNLSKNHEAVKDVPFSEIKRNSDKMPSSQKSFSSYSLLKDKIDSIVTLNSTIIESRNNIHTEKTNSFQENVSHSNKGSDCRTVNNNFEEITKQRTMLNIKNVEDINDPSVERIPKMDNLNCEEAFENIEVKDIIQNNVENVNIGLTCKICSKLFTDEELLTRHHLRAHERHYSCSECSAKFSTKSNLLVHMRRHTGEKPFCCHKCPANFTTNGNLQRHIRTHSGNKPWQCNKCGKCFTEKKSLTIHERQHTGEKPYECEVCGKRFSQSSILYTHMALHSDTKMHLCEVCGKCFRQKSQLRTHRQRHEKIRPFKCSLCSLAYITRGDLLRHEKSHAKEKPYKCDLCCKAFTRQQSLNEHKNRHYGIKPYKCKVCGKGFPELSGCYKHTKVHEKSSEAEDSNNDNNLGKAKIWRNVQYIGPERVGTSPRIKTREKDIKPETKKINKKKQDMEPNTEMLQQTISSVSVDQINEENELSNITNAASYIAVVSNAKHPNELGDEVNQAMSFFNPGLEENNLMQNGVGVLTAINILNHSTTFPQNISC